MIRCPFCDHKNPPGTARCGECQAELFASPSDNAESIDTSPQSLDGRVKALVGAGQKIEAIKLYRDLTGAGLKEAKDAVEALEREGSLPTPRKASSGADADVLDLLRAGQKIRAIKLYRDKTGVGLAEAKNAVEELARANGLPGGEQSAGCGGAAALMLALVVGALGYLVARLA
ncbi:MAG TPA: ribosomal protein L7/L12 [Planctomycetaceae bacterium]|jgi:ribosomal protein L7/L12|nr:ribosomal protein L7/L12 [Planctomycetaceae bacterium]